MIHVLTQIAFLTLLAVGIAVAASDHRHARRLSRLDMLLRGGKPLAVTEARDPMALTARLLPPSLLRNLQQLDITLSPLGIAATLGGAGLVGLAVLLLLGPLAATALLAGGALGCTALVDILAARRVARFASYLPGFLDRLRQLLSVGASLPTAFARTVQGAQPLVASFLEPTVRRIHNGAGFSDSMRQCADTIDLNELRLFAATVAANSRFGGSLNHALSNLVQYMRKRSAIERELRASTAQIRVSAWVLGLLPLLVAGAIMAQNPGYAAWFMAHPAGHKLLIYCGISQIAGAVLMRQIVRTRF